MAEKKSQDQINNERILAQQEELRTQKEGLTEKEKMWADSWKERDKKQAELLNQRKFFTDLQQGLKDGKVSSKDTIDYEESPELTSEEIEAMDDHDFSVWIERIQFAKELRETRVTQERNKIASAIAKQIEGARESDWAKKAELMTPSERQEFDRKLSAELKGLE